MFFFLECGKLNGMFLTLINLNTNTDSFGGEVVHLFN